MSTFSPEWLALREPADVSARNPTVLAACQRYFAQRHSLRICDIGAGTGASVRALADLLPQHQHWTLVDHDSNNLAAARESLCAWSDAFTSTSGLLILRRGNRHVEINTRVYDFGESAEDCWLADTDLVTASALLDLTSEAWISGFAAALEKTKTAVLATLTFDGEISSEPAHPLDDAVADAFRTHQNRDKGFGPAAGAASAALLQARLKGAGYKIISGDSAWRIEPSASAFFMQTLNGIADAVRETGLVSNIDAWRRERLSNTRYLTIGHTDIFAYPT